MMTHLYYDGTFRGFLSAVFEAYERKLNRFVIVKSEIRQVLIGEASVTIVSDSFKAERVWNGLKRKLSKTRCHELYQCFLSELPNADHVLTDFIRHVFANEKNIENDYGHPSVIGISQIAHKVHREKHRMEAFVRFQLTKEGFYFATIRPDFNVLPLIIRHFKERYADQDWLIYDNKRKYGVHFEHKTATVSEVSLDLTADASGDFIPKELCHEDEIEYQKLWKRYFISVNISSRKNEKLHVRHLPKRYWKYLTEKQEF